MLVVFYGLYPCGLCGETGGGMVVPYEFWCRVEVVDFVDGTFRLFCYERRWRRACCKYVLRGCVGEGNFRVDVEYVFYERNPPEANVIVTPASQDGSAGDRDDCVGGVVYVYFVLIKNRNLVGVGKLSRAE